MDDYLAGFEERLNSWDAKQKRLLRDDSEESSDEDSGDCDSDDSSEDSETSDDDSDDHSAKKRKKNDAFKKKMRNNRKRSVPKVANSKGEKARVVPKAPIVEKSTTIELTDLTEPEELFVKEVANSSPQCAKGDCNSKSIVRIAKKNHARVKLKYWCIDDFAAHSGIVTLPSLEKIVCFNSFSC